MTVRVLTLDELRPEHELGVVALRYLAFSDLFGTEGLRAARKLGFPLADYGALYAVDGTEVLATVEVQRPFFTTPEGTGRVGGLAYVATRPHAARQGLGSRLVQEVLDRQREAGDLWCVLSTSHHSVSHAFYETNGFTDVWEPVRGFKKVPARAPPPPGFGVRRAREAELPELDELRGAMAQGRTGFARRLPGHLEARWKGRMISLDDLVVLEKEDRPVAYGLLRRGAEGYTGAETVAAEERYRGPMVGALESVAQGGWLVLGASPFSWWAPALQERGYQLFPDSWGVLMACPLQEAVPAKKRAGKLGTDREGFISQATDGY